MTTRFPTLRPGAEPFFFRGGPVGCLCLHGFMSSPAEIRWLGEYLAQAGYTVYGPRLAGHGTDHRDMARMRWTDWYASALDGYHLLRAACERVFVVGHSMGGALALLLAANLPLDGAAALAAPAGFEDRRVRLAHLLRYVRPYTDQSDKTMLPQIVRQEQNRRGEPARGRVRYDLWATAAVGQLQRASLAMLDRLPDVTAPLLLIYSQRDPTIPLGHQERIAARAGSAVIEQHRIQQSGHIIVQDVERDIVFRLVTDFIAARLNTLQP